VRLRGSIGALVAVMLAVPAAASASPWSAPSVLGPANRDTVPRIAVAPDGEAVAVWEGGKPNGIEVSTRQPGGDWTAPTLLGPAQESNPRVAVSGRKAVVVWTATLRHRGSETPVVMAATRLRGKPWGKARNVSREARWRYEPSGSAPAVTIARGGKATVIWTADDERHEGSYIRSATQPAKGTGWSRPIALPRSTPGEAAQIGSTPSGEAVAIWGASYNEESGIEVSSRPANGKWRPAGRLGHPGPFPEPQLTVTPSGEAIGLWLKSPEDNIGSVLEVATRPPGGKWKVKALAPESFSSSPSIVTEPGGRVRVAWTVGGLFGAATEAVSSTHSPGAPWTAPTPLADEGLAVPEGATPQLAVTAAGESFAAWTTEGPGAAPNIQTATRPPGGTWTAPTDLFPPPPSRHHRLEDLQLLATPGGEALAIWLAANGSGHAIEAATARG
jgi:hypothetical protein